MPTFSKEGTFVPGVEGWIGVCWVSRENGDISYKGHSMCEDTNMFMGPDIQ